MQPINRTHLPQMMPEPRPHNFITQYFRSCWPGQEKVVTPLSLPQRLPWLLDHKSTKDLLPLLQEPYTLASLSRLQIIRLASIQPSPALPSFVAPLIDIFHHPEDDLALDLKKIKQLAELSEEEKDAALAHFIELHQLSLNNIRPHVLDEELLRLAPYLRYLDLGSFPDLGVGIKLVQNCPNLNVLIVNSTPMIDFVTALPLCHTLDCSGCTFLNALPELPLCHSLSCSNCSSLTTLPPLPMCQKLVCTGCISLNNLPALPQCQKVYLNKCTSLKSLPALLQCQTLECEKCYALSSLPLLPHCLTLICTETKVIALPDLPLCQKLDCSHCSLSTLPMLPLCKEVKCISCLQLSTLQELPICEYLDCTDCTVLNALPPLPLCQMLYCNGTNLTALPQLPACNVLSCENCTALSALPPLPNCEELHCGNCPLTEYPEIPWFAEVFTYEDSLPLTSLEIDVERFATEPVALLLLLGRHLLNKNPFPIIYYFENNELNEAIDYGGIRRDFVTKLCLHLFTAHGLKIEDNFPLSSDNDEKAFRTLGAIMAHCYPKNSLFKTGPLFDPEVYECMATPNPGTDEWFLTNYLKLVEAPDLNQEAKECDLTKLAYLVEPDATDISKYTLHYFREAKNREALLKSLLMRAKQDKRLKAIAWMAEEMDERVVLAGNIQERIEGILSKEALKQKLIITDAKARQYLTDWIDNHPDKLEKFVYAVTGNRTLCANQIIIEVYDRDKEFIPISHTCAFTLELSSNYESQKIFNEKMNFFLENALAGSGFTFA